MDSILLSTKKSLGLGSSYEAFDPEIIMHINSALFDANQIGIGPAEGFSISGEDEVWADLIGARKDLEALKLYVYLKVKLIFDPPATSFVLEAMNKKLSECEWRLNHQAEPAPPVTEEVTTDDE